MTSNGQDDFHDRSPQENDMSDTADFAAHARDLQLDALLHEAAGEAPSPSLADRILEALPTPGGSRTRARSWQRQWLAAAIVLFAVTVVGGIAYLQRGGDSGSAPAAVPAEQDPQGGGQDPLPTKRRVANDLPITVIADYSDNRVIVLAGNRIRSIMENVFGAWDAELTPDGGVLVTEFSVSRVQRYNRRGKVVWAYEKLKNPYDADLLPSGNVLIADTFAGRVVEVNASGEEVWEYDGNIRPFDVDRLPNGNTLIADVIQDRVIEVNRDGEIVWQVGEVPNVHDADRLANGNTLITLRNKGTVLEVDPKGTIVWQVEKLSSPSDADRLPNGNTLIAENTRVREFDEDGKVVWQFRTTWAVEVNRTYEKGL